MEKKINSISKQQVVKNFLMIFLTFFLLSYFTESYALVFNITPIGTLPTTVSAGGTVNASYLVANNTVSQRNSNFVKYLPPNVSPAGGGCASNFNLAPKGHSGDTCILNLKVSGAVNAADPDPHHHLFICFPGGITCAGTNYPLNVVVVIPPPTPTLVSITIAPTNPSIARNTTQQFTVTGTLSDGSTQDITSQVTWSSSNTLVATVSSTGLVTGVGAGTTTITATFGSFSTSTVLTVNPLFAYVGNFTNNTVSLCSLTSSGTLSGCVDSGAGAVFNQPAEIVFNPTSTRAYVTNFAGGAGTVVSLCSANPSTGFLSGCVNADGDGSAVFNGPFGMTLDASGTHAYVANVVGGTVSLCNINSGTGQLTGCVNTGSGFTTPSGITLNPDETSAYVANALASSVSLCSVDSATGALSGCANADGDGSAVFAGPALMSINNAVTHFYTSENNSGTGTNVALCSINASDQLIGCVDSGAGAIFSSPVSVTLNVSNSLIYVSNNTSTTVFLCSVNSTTGVLSGCVNADGDGSAVFAGPAGVTLN